MKICTKCKTESDLFGSNKATKDKLDSWCKICKNKQNNNRRDIEWRTKLGHLSKILNQRKCEARKKNIPYDIDAEYALSIAQDVCPVLGIKLSWGERKGNATDSSPSLDKFVPELGYVKGNVAWISFKANTIKSNANAEEIQAVANWMRKIQNEPIC